MNANEKITRSLRLLPSSSHPSVPFFPLHRHQKCVGFFQGFVSPIVAHWAHESEPKQACGEHALQIESLRHFVVLRAGRGFVLRLQMTNGRSEKEMDKIDSWRTSWRLEVGLDWTGGTRQTRIRLSTITAPSSDPHADCACDDGSCL